MTDEKGVVASVDPGMNNKPTKRPARRKLKNRERICKETVRVKSY